MESPSDGLVFGIHPFGVAGMGSGVATGPPDDFSRLPQIIKQLRGDKAFLLRSYVPYTGVASVPGIFPQFELFARSGEAWDIALCFRNEAADLTGWLELVREIVTRYGNTLNTLQITNEPNLKHMPDAGDGSRPRVLDALREGVIAAKKTARELGATVSVGFNAVPTFDPGDNFWAGVNEFGDAFVESLDYVGIDFYPDVFGPPIPLEHLPAAVEHILSGFRASLASAEIPSSVPIRITENGWPTGPGRDPERQAQVLETIIRAIHALRARLNITHYELFGLRDANSSNPNSFYQFGILRDDYTPKPALAVYQKLIAELGRA